MTDSAGQVFDLIVVGGGQAGCAAALAAAGHGRSVAVIESRPAGLGGASVHEADLPAAVARETTALLRSIHRAAECAVVVPDAAEPDFAGLARRRVAQVAAAVATIRERLEAAGVAIFHGRGYLAAADSVAVLDPETGDDIAMLRGRVVVLATGSVPAPPAWFQADGRHLLTLPQVWTLRRRPKSALILGAGPDACEAATHLASTGTTVYMAFPGPSLLGEIGDEMAQCLAAAFQRDGMSLAALATPAGCAVADGACVTTLTLATGEELLRTETVVWSGPERAATDNLGLRKLGVIVDEATGRIETDADGATAAPTVYAVGACTLSSCSALEARLLGEWLGKRLAGVAAACPNLRDIPRLLATHPPAAWVGMTPAEAAVACPGARAATMEIPDGLFGQASRGTAVIVGDPATGEILGAQAVGPVAPAFVPAVALARQFEYCLDDLAGLIPAEPYLSAPLATAARAWLRASNRPV